MIKAILFDLDGTLATLKTPFEEIVTQTLQPIFEPSVGFTIERFLQRWRKALSKEGPLDTLQALAKTIHRHIPDLEDLAYSFRSHYQKNITELIPIEPLLSSLSPSFSLGIVTNGPYDLQEATIHVLNLKKWVNTVVISGDPSVAVRKPNPKIFQLALEQLGCLPEEILMIGDQMETDILPAYLLGFHVVLLGEREITLPRKKERIVQSLHSLEALPSLLREAKGLCFELSS